MGADAISTDRLELRRPVASDRSTFVSLFSDDDFMVFSGGALSTQAAGARFDVMLANAAEVPFAKQPIIERSTERIIGYCGVAWFEVEGRRRLEFGWRLVADASGSGYATEAGQALIGLAAEKYDGEILAMIDPTNAPSKKVAEIHRLQVTTLATV